jgi:predicted RNA-binding protein YlqC (UPF0109 family)
MNDAKLHPLEALTILVTSGFVSHPKDLRTEIQVKHYQAFLTVTGNRADISKLAGTKGKNIDAVREIIDAAGTRRNIKTRLTLLEGWTGVKPEPAAPGTPWVPWAADKTWTPARTMAIIKTLEGIAQSLTDGYNVTFEEVPEEFTTRIVLWASTTIRPATIVALQDIFRAIGRNQGREIRIDVQHGTPALQPSGSLASPGR